MFGAMNSGAAAYAKVNVETGVAAASPHKLIMMLFDGATVSVASAINHLQTGDIPAKGQAISRAISIIDSGLRASLDKSAGGELAQNLDALYSYMCNRLLQANLENQKDYLEEVQRLLKDLRDAWAAIEPKPAEAAEAPVQQAAPSAAPKLYDALTPAPPQRLMKA
jgi:flagellar protein FliS